MTVLSRQSIIRYMNREIDPLEVYSIRNGQKQKVSESQIDSQTVNLSVGDKVGELDLIKVAEDKGVHPLDIVDYLAYRGINPHRDREFIEKNSIILDLSDLSRYNIEEEGRGDFGCYSWKVETDDDYTFRTRIVVDEEDNKKASEIIFHPDKYHWNLQAVRSMEFCRSLTKALEENVGCLSLLKEKRINSKAIDEKIGRLRNLSTALNHKFIFPQRSTPSTSFAVVWTDEYVGMPLDLQGRIDTKSKYARLAFSSHHSSGKVDPGFHNKLALEFKNDGNIPITLGVRDPVAEIGFIKLDEPTELGYSQRENALYKKDRLIF